MRPVNWSQPARRDFLEIDAYYRPRQPGYAQEVIERAVAAGEFLRGHPEAGEAIEETALRKWRVTGTPYILLYRVTDRAIRIARVVHAARDWRRFV